jgi:hypothetical protein
MKTLLLYIFLLTGSLLMGLNESRAMDVVHTPIPDKVLEKLNSMYPNMKEPITWKEGGGKYKADFVLNNKSISLVFKKDGELIDSKVEIEITELPARVLAPLKKDYLDYDYKTVYIMRKLVEGVESYEVEVMKGRLVYVMRYDKDGTPTNKFMLRRWDTMNDPASEGGF